MAASSALNAINATRSEEHTSELQSRPHLVCRLLLEKKKKKVDVHAAIHCANRRPGHSGKDLPFTDRPCTVSTVTLPTKGVRHHAGCMKRAPHTPTP